MMHFNFFHIIKEPGAYFMFKKKISLATDSNTKEENDATKAKEETFRNSGLPLGIEEQIGWRHARATGRSGRRILGFVFSRH